MNRGNTESSGVLAGSGGIIPPLESRLWRTGAAIQHISTPSLRPKREPENFGYSGEKTVRHQRSGAEAQRGAGTDSIEA